VRPDAESSARSAVAATRASAPQTLSVVIPTLDEAERLPRLLDDLDAVPEAEVVVVDGGSVDGTPGLARRAGATVVETAASRGVQLRAGAEVSSGHWLFFVHADCRLGAEAAEALRRFPVTAREEDFAHFGFELEGSGPIHRFIEWGQGLRERWLGLVYGDQGLIVSRALYRRVSGYPPWPLMEDVEMIRRLEAQGRRIALPATLVASSRRYDREGGLRRWMRNVVAMTLFQAGVDPRRLDGWYDPGRPSPPRGPGRQRRPGQPARPSRRSGPGRAVPGGAPSRRLVGVFAKAPTPGRVKTRLAADLGDRRATEIYRILGRGTVDALRGGPYRLVVFVDPAEPDAFDAVRA
jgi:rSAM/selenodomain-associated transferase 2